MGALTLVACSQKEDAPLVTQAAAKVGTEEISVHQINQFLGRSHTVNASAQELKVMSTEVLEKLIDQELAVQQATELNLHRAVDVVAQLEASRRQILARSYLKQMTASLPKPTQEETQQYYQDHPALFAQRRIFNVQEITLPPTPGVAEQLQAFATAGKPAESIAQWLTDKEIKFSGSSATRVAEQIPLDMLPQVHALKDGQALVQETASGISFLRVVTSQLSPIPEADALPRIGQFLSNQRSGEAVSNDLKRLRANTKVTYMGAFAQTASASAATGVVAPSIAGLATPSRPTPQEQSKSAIEAGIAGLK